jgi:hypothetical protein
MLRGARARRILGEQKKKKRRLDEWIERLVLTGVATG